MTRFPYIIFALIFVALNAATHWPLQGSSVELNQVVLAALITNALGGLWLSSSLTEFAKSPVLNFCAASTPGQLP